MSEEITSSVVTMESVLGTDDPTKQLAMVKQMAVSAASPVIVFTAVVDTRTNKVDVLINGQYTFDQVYELLDTVRRELVRQEREALIHKE